MLYRLVFELGLRRLDPERAHELAAKALRVVPRRARPDAVLRTDALGTTFPSPLVAAAGFDKNATMVGGLTALGFGAVEVGTVTMRAQPGNPRPRIFRRVGERALVNRMGFPNDGAAAVRARLERRRADVVVGVNVSKNGDVPLDDAAADCAAVAAELAPVADYLVVNVSSPNTPGLRDLQAIGRLRGVLEAVREAAPGVPLLVKISPDLEDHEIDEIAALAVELALDGVVAVNTTTAGQEQGGLSGAPLKTRALDVLRRLHETLADERPIVVSVGGIETADDAWQRIKAGATLVQAYTAFVYGGPRWPLRMNDGLAQLARAEGWTRVQDAVGAEGSRTVVETGNRP